MWVPFNYCCHGLALLTSYGNQCLAWVDLRGVSGQGHHHHPCQVAIGSIIADDDGRPGFLISLPTAGSNCTHHTSPRFIGSVTVQRVAPLNGLRFTLRV